MMFIVRCSVLVVIVPVFLHTAHMLITDTRHNGHSKHTAKKRRNILNKIKHRKPAEIRQEEAHGCTAYITELIKGSLMLEV